MENNWESKVDKWLSGESQAIRWLIDKLWIIVVEFEAARVASDKTKFKVPLYRKGFNNKKDLEDTSRILLTLNSKKFIVVDHKLHKLDEDVFHDPRTEIELTDGFKYLYTWLEKRKHPERFQGVSNSADTNTSNSVQGRRPDWKPQDGKKAILVLPNDAELVFRSGNFGGLNVLFENFGEGITRSQLRTGIYKCLQQNKKLSKNQINISAWIVDLKRRRKSFFIYFEIERYDPDLYRLVWVSPHKSNTQI